jgi:hypothetical protein
MEIAMRLSRLLPAAAAIVAIGAAAYAERPTVHVVEYRLPGGGVARVRYTGDVAPRLVVVPAAEEAASPFAMLDRAAAMMDAMVAQVAGVQGAPGGMSSAALAGAPAGAHWTSVSRTALGGKVCTSEVSMVSRGEGRAPQVVRKVSGDCAGQPAAPRPATPTPPVPPKAVPRDSI